MDLLCLSHLRWRLVYQRPQHLLSRAASSYRVFFFEEPELTGDEPAWRVESPRDRIHVVTPQIPATLEGERRHEALRNALDGLMESEEIVPDVLWYYTPMALDFSSHIAAPVTVYDCMDELSLFAGASPDLPRRERELLRRADLVFAGGRSIYSAKQQLHPRVHLFPSSVDAAHFRKARLPHDEPADQAAIERPRLGYCGVIDERLDLELVASLADARPDWQFVFIGPVVKISEASLPRRANIHYLGPKDYTELPAYLGGWDVGLMPFAHNDATRFISPTKTPEYLAAGLPVVSTSVRDVVAGYGSCGLVWIADEPAACVAAIEEALRLDPQAVLARADTVLANQSWDRTWREMQTHIEAIRARTTAGALHSATAAGRELGPAAVLTRTEAKSV